MLFVLDHSFDLFFGEGDVELFKLLDNQFLGTAFVQAYKNKIHTAQFFHVRGVQINRMIAMMPRCIFP
jgi:hypothetical protein